MRYFVYGLSLLALLCVPNAKAQDAQLVGIWEFSQDDADGHFISRLAMQANGRFDLVGEARLNEGVFGDLQNGEELASNPFSDIEQIVTTGRGNWRTVGDSLYLDVEEAEMVIDGVPAVEFYTAVSKIFARELADEEGILAEDYPAFEASIVELFVAELTGEALSETLDNRGAYVLAGDVLTISSRTEDGQIEVLEFHRVAAASAVAATSWGRVKAVATRGE